MHTGAQAPSHTHAGRCVCEGKFSRRRWNVFRLAAHLGHHQVIHTLHLSELSDNGLLPVGISAGWLTGKPQMSTSERSFSWGAESLCFPVLLWNKLFRYLSLQKLYISLMGRSGSIFSSLCHLTATFSPAKLSCRGGASALPPTAYTGSIIHLCMHR